jgi:hypothetical protein
LSPAVVIKKEEEENKTAKLAMLEGSETSGTLQMKQEPVESYKKTSRQIYCCKYVVNVLDA